MSRLTILMYHKIDELPAGRTFHGNYVRPSEFARQIPALLDAGYRPVTFDDWLQHKYEGASIPDRPLIVTFDDGYRDFERNAWPVLKQHGVGATVFLVASQIGGTNAWDPGEPQETLMDRETILRLQSDGVQFGSHGFVHRPLARIPASEARDELCRSRADLRQLLGREVDVFAYPFSNQSRGVRRLAREAGYRAAVRGKGRLNFRFTDVHGLRRIKVDCGMGVEGLMQALDAAKWKL